MLPLRVDFNFETKTKRDSPAPLVPPPHNHHKVSAFDEWDMIMVEIINEKMNWRVS